MRKKVEWHRLAVGMSSVPRMVDEGLGMTRGKGLI